MNRHLWLLLFLFILNSTLSAQYYVNGQSPFFTKWRQIETQNYRLIFPIEIEPLAQKYANYFDSIYPTVGKIIGHFPCKIPIIIHNRTAFSNGEVAWAPKRMNVYTTSSQTNYYQPFEQHLALHEYRHVAQIDKLNQGGTRFLYFIFGEQAIGGMLGWHVPRWWLEGDAVAYETGSTIAGRGRIPDFTMKLETQLAEVGAYSYPKAMFGSYKDNVPNHYELGYFLSAMPRVYYQQNIWDSVLNTVARHPLHPNPFSKGLKHITGLPERKVYSAIMDSVLNNKNKLSKANQQHIEISHQYKNPTSYYAPVATQNAVITYKTEFGRIPCFTRVDAKGNEKVFCKPGVMLDPTFSYNDSVLVWNEHKNTRWGNVSYNRIAKYDMRSQTFNYLTKRGRSYGSKLSDDNSKIISVETNDSLKWFITMRDASNGSLKWQMAFDSLQPTHPVWGKDSTEFLFISIGEFGKSIGMVNILENSVKWIVKDALNDFNYLRFYGSYFTVLGIWNNATNLIKYDFNDEKWSVLTDVENGAGEASIMNDTIYFTNYTQSGYQLVKYPLKVNALDFSPVTWHNPELASKLSEQENRIPFSIITDSLKTHQIQKFKRGKYFMNVHSWAPLAIKFDNSGIGPGITFMSQNVLSTATFVGGYQYYNADNIHELFAELNYYGFYPEISSSFRADFYDDSVSNKGKLYRQHYQKNRWVNKIAVPFNFDYRYWFRLLQPEFSYELNTIHPGEGNEVKYTNKVIHSFSYGLYFHNMRRSAYLDIQPKWGQILRVTYSHTPFDISQYGKLLSASADFYMPGLLNNHGFRVYTGWQQKEKGNQLSYSDRVRYPFGYTKVDNIQMLAVHAHYALPLWYPDLNAWEWLYIKRFKANLFYQYNQYENTTTKSNVLQSAGADLTMDCHVFRFVFPFNLGARYTRMISANNNSVQFLFSMNF